MNSRRRGLLFEILFTRLRFRILLMAFSATSAVFGLMAAFGQREFVDALLGQPALFQLADWAPTTWLLFCFFGLLGSLFGAQAANYFASRESFWMQRHLAQKLYRHVLTLQAEQMRGRTVGEVVSIYTTDIPGCTIFLDQSLPQGFTILFPLVLVPWVLTHFFGLSWTLVVTVLATTIFINFILAFRQSKFFFLFKTLAADRIGLANEWIQNIRTLRILGWTQAFEKKIFEVRKIETSNRIRMLTNGQSMNALSSSMTYFLNLVFVSAILHQSQSGGGPALSPGTFLAVLWIVAVFLTRPFRQLPWFFTFLFDGWTSLKRVHAYFSIQATSISVSTSEVLTNDATILQIENLNLELNSNRILSNVYLRLEKGEFVALVGEVGSGKSSLLLSLLGETSATFGSYQLGTASVRDLEREEMKAWFSFVAQEGFVISGSLRENVALTYDFPRTQDAQVLESLRHAEFSPDQERLESNGALDTQIGERGVNLSGGQRQRVSLARVDFNPAPILLFDDCFSALDVDTEQKLIDNLFLGLWKERSKIVATHRLSILDKADRIYFLQNGRVAAQGTLDELLETSSDFNDFFLREKSPVKTSDQITDEKTIDKIEDGSKIGVPYEE